MLEQIGLNCVVEQIGLNCAVFNQGKYMDIEFDFKGDPVGGVITNCKFSQHLIHLFHYMQHCSNKRTFKNNS